MTHSIADTFVDSALSLIERSITGELAKRPAPERIPVFFRADDIGVISDAFIRLLRCFEHYSMPLCLAVVPAWLTAERWSAISSLCKQSPALWCWHQHGWRHLNHEPSGKKCEFGPSRSLELVQHDLLRGKERLERILGPSFLPVFTPPWNRCSPGTLELLRNYGFSAVSGSGRISGNSPLLELNINVDMHTRKEPTGTDRIKGLTFELEQACGSGRIGIMIHHQRMTPPDFELLGGLLAIISRIPRLLPLHFTHLLP